MDTAHPAPARRGRITADPVGESVRTILASIIELGAHHAEELAESPRLLPCDDGFEISDTSRYRERDLYRFPRAR